MTAMTRRIQIKGSRRSVRRTAVALLGVFALASCRDLNVQNVNAPTADALTGAPSRATLERTAIGVQAEALNDLGGEIESWGIYGREAYNLNGSDPRETGEQISGPQDPGGRAGGSWVGKYGAIRTINTYLAALDNSSGIAETEIRASKGFAKTLKAWDLQKLAIRSGPTGIPVDVDRPISEEPAPLVSFADAMAAASAIMDDANADLSAGGNAFPFTFVGGYTGFTTPSTFAQFNRGLAAKILVQRATFANCAECWAQAATAIDQSFITTVGLPASLSLGVYYGYTGAPNEAENPVTEPLSSNHYWVHPSLITGAQLRPNGQPDLRLTSKTTKRAEPRSLNGLTAQYKPTMFNDPADPSVPDLGADIPWLINEELILLRAEIRWNTGNKAGAIADLNLVRQNAGGLAPTTLTAASSNDAFVTELLYNRLYSLMWTQGTRWIDARRYGRTGQLPIDRPGDVVHPNMLIPAAECDARGLKPPCSIGG